ncbi:MAG: radical SAM protein [Myxococcota bacterium]
MGSRRDMGDEVRRRLGDEIGTIRKDAPERVALVYPSPYAVGMSSLGFQTIYREINGSPGRAAHRAFLPDEGTGAAAADVGALTTYEAGAPVGDYPVLALSVAYEIELAGVARCLELAGMPALAEERGPADPLVLAGGPLTFSNPLPLAPFVDAVLMGEADETIHEALDVAFAAPSKRQALERLAATIPSCFVPALHGDAMPPVAKCDDARLPAHGPIRTPHTELSNMFLVEPERGCHRGCAYCVMRRSTNGGMRLVSKDRLLELVPEDARKVGLVGAAVTDHPQITDIVEALVERGCKVGISSLRADRLDDRFVAALKAGGNRTLTTASDGASQRLRDTIKRRAREDDLGQAAELVRRHGLDRLKLYMMLGLPDETDDDVDELVEFSVALSRIAPLSLGIAPFVSKRNTPLDGMPFAGMDVVERRLARLRKGVRGRVDIRSTSVRWAWVEYVLAQGGQAEGRAVLQAVRAGGRFRDWKAAFGALPADRPRRSIVRPGDRLVRPGTGRRLAVSG